jgi:hypothetical protein
MELNKKKLSNRLTLLTEISTDLFTKIAEKIVGTAFSADYFYLAFKNAICKRKNLFFEK